MKLLSIVLFFMLPAGVLAGSPEVTTSGDSDTVTVTSPKNRVVVLELYTSEGCSSCPPADHFLSQLKESGISGNHLIPMAFHVTYWDYIGWQDRFADPEYDKRQRRQAHNNHSSTVYTPQFLMSGDDFRRYSHFNDDVNKLVSQKAVVDLVLTLHRSKKSRADDLLHLQVTVDASKYDKDETGVYLVVLENNLTSQVDDGENEGETLHHDYVVRQMYGPFVQRKSDESKLFQKNILLKPEWKQQDLSVVAFAENMQTGEVLQAVRYELTD